MLKIPDFPSGCCAVLWDCQPEERDVFVAFDDTKIITYLYNKDSVQGLPCAINRLKFPNHSMWRKILRVKNPPPQVGIKFKFWYSASTAKNQFIKNIVLIFEILKGILLSLYVTHVCKFDQLFLSLSTVVFWNFTSTAVIYSTFCNLLTTYFKCIEKSVRLVVLNEILTIIFAPCCARGIPASAVPHCRHKCDKCRLKQDANQSGADASVRRESNPGDCKWQADADDSLHTWGFGFQYSWHP